MICYLIKSLFIMVIYKYKIKDYPANVNSNQPHVIVPVPMAYDQPKSYLAISILNTCCCCFVLGIVAIIFSVKTREANKYGNVGEAVKFSKKAKKFNILAFSIGCCFVILYVILTVIRASLNGSNRY